MKEILKDIYLIENRLGANVFLLKSEDCFDLIDSGLFKETNELINQLEENGFSILKLRNIILTHCHCDHIGGVSMLVEKSGAKVFAHKDDIPFILQKKVIDGPYHDMMVQEQKMMKQFGCNIEHVDLALADGDELDILDGLKIIQVPGHTPGSIALYQQERQIMFFGDVIRNKERTGLVIGVPEKFNLDTKQMMKDAEHLMSYPIQYALFSHGMPILEDVQTHLESALKPDEVDFKNRK